MVCQGTCAWLLLLAIASPVVQGILLCQNGGTYDKVRHECNCTAHFHGPLCEFSFVTSNPCSAGFNLLVLHDRGAVHRLGNHDGCGGSPGQECIDFSVMKSGWYRLQSPAGNYLISQCPTSTVDCGSLTPYILANEVQEDNANVRLSRARAVRYRPGLPNGCHTPADTSYPVRILRCSPYLTVYYLQPLPRKNTHYCIGDKRHCTPGTISIDGTGFEPCTVRCSPRLVENPVAPVVRLEYQKKPNGFFNASFYCNVFSIFRPNWTDVDAVRYQVDFLLTLRNGTTIRRCESSEQIIEAGRNRTFECDSDKILTDDFNVYGGSLVCRVQARCDRHGFEYNSAVVPSNSHGFFFTHWFANETGVIRPNEPVTLCISSLSIPVNEIVTFQVSVGRRQIILNDRINVSVVRRVSNESCGFEMLNNWLENKRICMDLTLYNQDPDGRIPLGLEKADQISVIKVNISYLSAANGLSTMLPNGTLLKQRIHDIELKVDLTRLQTEVKTFLHIFTDPYIKPANRDYSGRIHVTTTSVQHFMLVKHKLLPYEIQGTIVGDSTTEVTIRYVYDIINIYGIYDTKRLTYNILRKPLPPDVKDPLRKKPDGLPFGVTVTATPQVIKVRFDLYGTTLYIWGFLSNPDVNACPHNFIMSNAAMNGQPCTGTVHQPNLARHRITLDVMLVPGFYDTPNHVEGMLFASTTPQPIYDPRDAILDHNYQMKPIQAVNSTINPTEVLSICSCGEESGGRLTSNCFVSIDNIDRGRKPAESLKPQLRPLRAPSSRKAQSQMPTRQITEQEADEMCRKFVQIQLSKSVSTEICSATKDPTGQSDYISQFKQICAQYATTLGTYEYSQSVFNSVLGMCYTDMTFNATVVLGNSSQIEMLEESICPANCSGRGSCLSGECRCDEGFWGTSCELEISKIDQMPTEIALLQQDVFCPSDSCSAVYLMVKPLLKSEDCVCNIVVDSSLKFTVPATYISGDIVMCDLTSQHRWLHNDVRMYAPLQIRVTAATWEATNTIHLLLHQPTCGGRPVVCDATSMTCRLGSSGAAAAAGSQTLDPSVEINICLPPASHDMSEHPGSAAVLPVVSGFAIMIPWLLSARLLMQI